ncbi:MAG TPA: phosphatase PAP2 family protein, partial [Bacteroidota bacterium]|nr:phosphatase PAP2 family protein [Bacteroidota bacterium]
MTNKKLRIGTVELLATDGLILGTLALFCILELLFCWKVEGWWMLILKNVGAGVLYILFNQFSRKATKKFWKFFLRMAAITLAYAYLFGAVDKLQLILWGHWMDSHVLAMEQSVFGVQPTLWLQQFMSPGLTEWMMFSYVFYLPMYPVLCGIIYYLHGDLAMEDYFFTLGFTNILCDLGFILFPVAGPIAAMGSQYTVPLQGYIWTYFGELMRSNVHYVGGTIPSPHAAAATIMWLMAYRYHRTSFWLLAPVVLSLYVSTFYGRYHYVTDAVVGIIVAFLALALAPRLMKVWDKIAGRQGGNSVSLDPT